jgi:probable rRNA maturation factor
MTRRTARARPGAKRAPAPQPRAAAAARQPARPAVAARRPAVARVDVAVSYGVPRAGLPTKARFAQWIGVALAGRRGRVEVSIRVVDADEGRALNRAYRRKDYATNVLSFPADLPPGVDVPLLGDLVLCAPVVAAEAKAQGKPLVDHFAHLTMHGALHLVGYDHETPAEARVMEAVEREALESIGIPDPYRMR